MGNPQNQGIQMSGGSIAAGGLAVGPGATVNHGTTERRAGLDEIDRRLAELLRQLDAHAASLAHGDQVRASAEVVVDELGKKSPNKITVTGVLAGIAAAVSSVAGLATATDGLLEAVNQAL